MLHNSLPEYGEIASLLYLTGKNINIIYSVLLTSVMKAFLYRFFKDQHSRQLAITLLYLHDKDVLVDQK